MGTNASCRCLLLHRLAVGNASLRCLLLLLFPSLPPLALLLPTSSLPWPSTFPQQNMQQGSMAADAGCHKLPTPLPPRVRVIVKLGGAAITDKSKFETPRLDVITQLASDVAHALASRPQQQGVQQAPLMPGADVAHASASRGQQGAQQAPLTGGADVVAAGASSCHPDIILVHGAGSFGHHQAKQYGVSAGGLDRPGVRLGASMTRHSVSKLSLLVVGALLDQGVPACAVPPMSSGWRTNNRQVVAHGCQAAAECLSHGLVPVLHGDVVFDEQLGVTVLSGDTLVAELAKLFRPDFVLFLTNVAGVYDRAPQLPDSRLLRSITVAADGSWQATAGDKGGAPITYDDMQHVEDVTGGMRGKVEEAAVVARLGVPVLIAEAGTVNARTALCSSAGGVLGSLDEQWSGLLGTVVSCSL